MKRSDVFRKLCTNYYGMSEAETENWVKRLFKEPQEKEDSTMPKCPWCGSTAQVRETDTEYLENGWSIEVRRHYRCGCGTCFVHKSWFESDGYEEVEVEIGRG